MNHPKFFITLYDNGNKLNGSLCRLRSPSIPLPSSTIYKILTSQSLQILAIASCTKCVVIISLLSLNNFVYLLNYVLLHILSFNDINYEEKINI